MNMKQAHCSPICAIPSNAAAHAPPLISLQHLTSARLAGRVRMLPMAAMLLSPPSSTHHGERPSLECRCMILMCCGRYETRMPSTITEARETTTTLG